MNVLLVDFSKIIFPSKRTKKKKIKKKIKKEKKTKDIKQYYRSYYYKNKDIIINRSRDYKYNNKELIKLKSLEYKMIHEDDFKQRFICLCGSNILKKGFSIHRKSLKHKIFIRSFLNES